MESVSALTVTRVSRDPGYGNIDSPEPGAASGFADQMVGTTLVQRNNVKFRFLAPLRLSLGCNLSATGPICGLYSLSRIVIEWQLSPTKRTEQTGLNIWVLLNLVHQYSAKSRRLSHDQGYNYWHP